MADRAYTATVYRCEDCPWTGTEGEMTFIAHVEERVSTGELMAPGCCPECGSLIGVADADVPDYTLEACAVIMRARGWSVTEPEKPHG